MSIETLVKEIEELMIDRATKNIAPFITSVDMGEVVDMEEKNYYLTRFVLNIKTECKTPVKEYRSKPSPQAYRRERDLKAIRDMVSALFAEND